MLAPPVPEAEPAQAESEAEPQAAPEQAAPAAKPVVRLDYGVGDTVEITDGLYAGTHATVTAIDLDKGVVTVSFSTSSFDGAKESLFFSSAPIHCPTISGA